MLQCLFYCRDDSQKRVEYGGRRRGGSLDAKILILLGVPSHRLRNPSCARRVKVSKIRFDPVLVVAVLLPSSSNHFDQSRKRATHEKGVKSKNQNQSKRGVGNAHCSSLCCFEVQPKLSSAHYLISEKLPVFHGFVPYYHNSGMSCICSGWPPTTRAVLPK